MFNILYKGIKLLNTLRIVENEDIDEVKKLSEIKDFLYGDALLTYKILLKYQSQMSGNDFILNSFVMPRMEGKKKERRIEEHVKKVEIDINTLPWLDSKTIKDKDGRLLTYRKMINPPNEFWNLWNNQMEKMKRSGITIKKSNNVWIVRWWKIKKERDFKISEPDKLKSFQINHTLNLMKILYKKGRALDASDTGTGKTYTAISCIRDLGYRAFVICPKSGIFNWEIAAKYFNVELFGIANYELAKNGKMIEFFDEDKFRHVNCPYITIKENENMGKHEPKNLFHFDFPNDVVLVFDEAHRTKNRNTINSQLIISAAQQKCKILALSATIADTVLNLYTIAFILRLYSEPLDFYKWILQFGCKRVKVNQSGATTWKFNGDLNNIMKIHNIIFPEYGSRMKISEIPDFPKTLITAELYYMDSYEKIQELYDIMFSHLDEISSKKIVVNQLTIDQKKQEQVEILKVPTFIELTQDLIESGNSVVIFVNFKRTLELITKKLKTRCTYYGGNDKNANEQNRIRFQDDKERVIVCTIKGAKETISLHDIHDMFPRVSLISPTYSSQDLKQCLGRIQRAGGMSKSIQKILLCANTIEENIYKHLNQKLLNINLLNDGDLKPQFDITVKTLVTTMVKDKKQGNKLIDEINNEMEELGVKDDKSGDEEEVEEAINEVNAQVPEEEETEETDVKTVEKTEGAEGTEEKKEKKPSKALKGKPKTEEKPVLPIKKMNIATPDDITRELIITQADSFNLKWRSYKRADLIKMLFEIEK